MTKGSKKIIFMHFQPDAEVCVKKWGKGYTFMTTFLEYSLSV